MDENLVTLLANFNLTQDEATTYLAALSLGKATAYEIAKEVGLVRANVYVHLDKLRQKGLVTQQRDGHRQLVVPIPPRQLVSLWRGRVELLEAIQPELNLLARRRGTQPRIQIFEGKSGVATVYQEFPPTVLKGEMLLFGSIGAINAHFSQFTPRWQRLFKHKKNRIREIFSDTPEVLKSHIDFKQRLGNPHYQYRFVPPGQFGATDNILLGDTIGIFSLGPEFYAILIESADIARTYRTLFEHTWAAARTSP